MDGDDGGRRGGWLRGVGSLLWLCTPGVPNPAGGTRLDAGTRTTLEASGRDYFFKYTVQSPNSQPPPPLQDVMAEPAALSPPPILPHQQQPNTNMGDRAERILARLEE